MEREINLRSKIIDLSFFLFVLFIPLLSHAVIIEGRVFDESEPMKGAKVYA